MAWQRRYRRPDRRRNRVRRPPPQEGFLVRDLARLAGVSIPTIKRYVRHGLLAPVPFYGTATRYPRDYLTRVLALRYWRAQGNKTLAELRRRLDAVTFAEMQQWVMSHPLSADTAVALRAGSENTAQAGASTAGPNASAAMHCWSFRQKAGNAGLSCRGSSCISRATPPPSRANWQRACVGRSRRLSALERHASRAWLGF